MHHVNLQELKDRTERLVINDLAFQDPMLMFCEIDITVNLFERHTDDWVALVDVEGPDIDMCFYEISYILDKAGVEIGSFRALDYNPYISGRLHHAA